jgi:imidazolonepropionase-like amidohydrolase
MLLIKGGKVVTMAGLVLDGGDVLVDNGKIMDVRDNIEVDCRVIDAKGMWVLPGLIEAHCHIGLEEPGVGAAGSDVNESTEPVTPYLNALDGINFSDESFRSALSAGITTVCTGPGSANVIGGTFSILKTYGGSPYDMVIREKAAMKAALGENPKRIYGGKGKMPSTRMGIAYLLRDVLIKTENYIRKKNRTLEKKEAFEEDLKFEELIPVIEGIMPLKIHAHKLNDIITAIRIADEYGIKITLDHCSEGLEIIEEIKKRDIPAIVGPTMTFKGKAETKGKTFKTAGEFAKRGIVTAITTDHPVTQIEYLPICAGLCVREGMDFYHALEAITINPAKILGIDRRVGSIEVGKDADIIVLDGNPLEVMTRVKLVIGKGEIVLEDI